MPVQGHQGDRSMQSNHCAIACQREAIINGGGHWDHSLNHLREDTEEILPEGSCAPLWCEAKDLHRGHHGSVGRDVCVSSVWVQHKQWPYSVSGASHSAWKELVSAHGIATMNGVMLKAAKCAFFQDSVEFFGPYYRPERPSLFNQKGGGSLLCMEISC